MNSLPTEKENYEELWLKYYNIIVDIIRAYKNMDNHSNLAYQMFGFDVEHILRENDLID